MESDQDQYVEEPIVSVTIETSYKLFIGGKFVTIESDNKYVATKKITKTTRLTNRLVLRKFWMMKSKRNPHLGLIKIIP